jgi:hypothetical protein
LDQADVDPTLADFMEEDKVAQIVVCQLLNTIDDLRKELEQEKRARRDADTQLIRATHKRPNPQSPLTEDGEGRGQAKWLRSAKEKRVTATLIPTTLLTGTKMLWEMGHDEPISQAPSTVDDVPPPVMGDDASETEETKHRKRRGAGKMSTPTPYVLPGPVTITPGPSHDPAPEETPQLKFTDAGEDTNSDDEGLMEPIEGELKQQIEQQKAHNYRVHQKRSTRKSRMKTVKNDQKIFNESCPGCVPDRLGMVTIGQHPE